MIQTSALRTMATKPASYRWMQLLMGALEALRASGKTEVILLKPAEKSEWKKALTKVHREMEGKIGKDLVRSIYKETGFDPDKL
jgi:hypothetical protein